MTSPDFVHTSVVKKSVAASTSMCARHPFTNDKLEAINRSLETELLDVEELSSLKEAEERIRRHMLSLEDLARVFPKKVCLHLDRDGPRAATVQSP